MQLPRDEKSPTPYLLLAQRLWAKILSCDVTKITDTLLTPLPGSPPVLYSEKSFLPPCFCPPSKMWKVQQDIAFCRKLKLSIVANWRLNMLFPADLWRFFLIIIRACCIRVLNEKWRSENSDPIGGCLWCWHCFMHTLVFNLSKWQVSFGVCVYKTDCEKPKPCLSKSVYERLWVSCLGGSGCTVTFIGLSVCYVCVPPNPGNIICLKDPSALSLLCLSATRCYHTSLLYLTPSGHSPPSFLSASLPALELPSLILSSCFIPALNCKSVSSDT